MTKRFAGTRHHALPSASATLTLGLAAFERISAVEGIFLDDRMRKDLERIAHGELNEQERSRFVLERYGLQ